MSVLTTGQSRNDQAWKLSSGIGSDPTTTVTRKPWRWPYLAAFLSWVLYSVVAVWMTEVLHLQIGDAQARMNDARAMLFSRDPHLAAIGLYWMPLPTLGQLPFMLIVSPLRHAELSGPLACAFCGALTVLVMAKVAWTLELSKPTAVILTLAYALNPIVLYTNGNGMSEAWSFLGLAITMLGFLRWSRNHRTIDLAVLAGGLAVVMLTRYEAIALAPIMAVVAALNDGRGPPEVSSLKAFVTDVRSRARRWATTAAIVVMPTYFVLALWMLMNLVIARNALYFYQLQKSQGHTTPGTYTNLPAHNLVSIGAYCLTMMVATVPAMLVLTPLLLFRKNYHDVLTGLGIAIGGLIWPVIVAFGLFVNESAGAPRYFEPAVVFAGGAAMWLAANLWKTRAGSSKLAVVVTSVAVAIGALVGAIGLDNPVRTHIEQESHFFSILLGHPVAPVPSTYLSRGPLWEELSSDLDAQLQKPGNKVLVDVSAPNFGAFLYTRYPDRYIVNSDRDYLQILADPTNKFNYLILPINHQSTIGDIGTEYTQLQSVVFTTTGGHWVKWRTYYVAIVYRWIPDVRGPGASTAGSTS